MPGNCKTVMFPELRYPIHWSQDYPVLSQLFSTVRQSQLEIQSYDQQTGHLARQQIPLLFPRQTTELSENETQILPENETQIPNSILVKHLYSPQSWHFWPHPYPQMFYH